MKVSQPLIVKQLLLDMNKSIMSMYDDIDQDSNISNGNDIREIALTWSNVLDIIKPDSLALTRERYA